MTVAERLAERKIREVLHFTTNRGVVGTLASGSLQSRFRLPEDKYLEHIVHMNAAVRPEAGAFFDKSQNWLDYVNLSISEINRRYFKVSQGWHLGTDIWWAILAFDPIIMTHDDVWFATTNNKYDRCARAGGVEGLDALFAPVVPRIGASWSASRGSRLPELPTCEQAEVLYPSAVSCTFLRRIYVRDEDEHDQASGWLRDFPGVRQKAVEVVLSPQKFDGKPN